MEALLDLESLERASPEINRFDFFPKCRKNTRAL
jgi:hypothetical protein